MALIAGTLVEFNASATANNVNGGGFNPNNANFPTDLAADTNTGNTSAPVVSSASYNFVAGDVGAWVYVKSGSNAIQGLYQIASVASNKATLNATIGQAVIYDSTTAMWKPSNVVGIATVATPTGLTWGVDYSQGTAAIANFTNLASTNGTTNPSVVTSASLTFGVNHVGNIIHVTAGTSWTASWYEIVSVSGGAATLDRAVGSAASLSNGTFYVGGAMSMNSTLDDDVLEIFVGAIHWFKSGTFITGETVSLTNAGTSTAPIMFIGYQTVRGDNPSKANQPVISAGANSFALSAFNYLSYISFTSTAAAGISLGTTSRAINCSFYNSSTTANRVAVTLNTGSHLHNVEAVSLRGRAIELGSNSTFLKACYVHDSDVNLFYSGSGTAGHVVEGTLIAGAVTQNVRFNSTINSVLIRNNTIYGSSTTYGIGISMASGGGINSMVENNIITGCATGISHADSTLLGQYSNYNNYYNNDTDVTNWKKGLNDSALNPTFTSVSEVTGTGATSSGSTLTDGSKNFTTAGVVAGRDFLYVISATGITVGKYGIATVGTTTLTTDISLGTGSNINYEITIGRNWEVGTNMKAIGTPGSFDNISTTSYTDLGAVQRQEPSSSGGIIRLVGDQGGLVA